MTDLRDIAEVTIRVWRFDDAPEHLRDFSNNEGDEDWLVLVPYEVHETWGCTPSWIDAMDSRGEPQVRYMHDGVVYIGSHA